MRTRTVWLLAPLVALGCGHNAAKPRRGAVERLPRLEVVTPQRATLARRVDLAASVDARKRVDLAARVPGVVEYLPDDIDLGRRVKKGEVLLRLAVPELVAERKNKEAMRDQARKQRVLAEEALAVARREVEETQKEDKRFAA